MDLGESGQDANAVVGLGVRVMRYVPAPMQYGEAAQSQILEIMGLVDLPGFRSTGPMI